MDRRVALGMSKAELVMSRVGQVMGALLLVVLLPVLPILLLYFGFHKAGRTLNGGPEREHGPNLSPE